MTSWCNPRPTENGNSCRVRTTAIWNFIGYARKRKWTESASKRNPTNVPCAYIPHYFTQEELTSFFLECDSYFLELSLNKKGLQSRLNRLELPVFFRLLLSSGMRTCEARWLKCQNVDLDNGVIEIEKSKGADQHRIALHESMLSILIAYDEAMSKLMPRREYFFPDRHNNEHSPAWESYHFRNIWYKSNTAVARAYDLRSQYAVTNITKWENHGYELSGKLLFLSRSMGHKNIQSTYGYFHLTPMLTDKLKRNTESGFNNILPQLPDHENQE
ncbi:tyrosine-type recombinase/integrase [Arachidicoccus soli]|nr:tyrosine-type recombinase/integrase [Arachidicoccus soli]